MEEEILWQTNMVEGTTYGKRRRRHEWIQLVEAQATDNPEGQKIVLAVHGGGIEGGTSEIALVYRERSHLQKEDLGCYKNECQLEDL